VTLSGRVPLEGAAKISVSGPAASHGTLSVSLRGRARGTLGGHRVSVNLLASSVSQARAVAAGLRQQRFQPFAASVTPPG
jgi:hypothetical protein